VNLWTTPERALLEVTDNGQGFDVSKMSVTLGHGLSNMHTRAYKVGGDVEISSEPGEGTSVLAWVPMRGISTTANPGDHSGSSWQKG
jgi:two-component system NarL family sensor kinase